MLAFVLLVLGAIAAGLFLNNLDLRAELQSRPPLPESEPVGALSAAMRFGVTPEGIENAAHRRTDFPKNL